MIKNVPFNYGHPVVILPESNVVPGKIAMVVRSNERFSVIMVNGKDRYIVETKYVKCDLPK